MKNKKKPTALFTRKQKQFLQNIEDWTITIHNDSIELIPELSSNYDGVQWICGISSFEDFCKEADYLYESFDPSYEAYLWLDSEGHGKNGAPYEMGDVFAEMKELEDKLKHLSDVLFAYMSSTEYIDDDELVA